MDRLSLVALPLLALLGACSGEQEPSQKAGQEEKPAPSRVNAVPAAPKKPVNLDEFCEVRPEPAQAPALSMPPLDGASPPASQGWTWVNLWATWCGPCIEEMPRLIEWEKKLAEQGAPVRLQLVSADAGAQEVENFRKKNKWMVDSLRLADPQSVGPWLNQLGKAGDPVLPVHLFVDPAGRVRCIREGAISIDEYDAVKAVVSAG